MNDLREKVARVIRDARALPGTNPVARLSDVDHRAADAAIQAVFDHLMEPSEAMMQAGEYDDGDPHGEWFGGSRLEVSWQAMLTKAKEEAGL